MNKIPGFLIPGSWVLNYPGIKKSRDWNFQKIPGVNDCKDPGILASLLMWFDGPNEVWKYGSIKSHEFFVYSCVLLHPETSCGFMDPENHQGSIKPHEVLVLPKPKLLRSSQPHSPKYALKIRTFFLKSSLLTQFRV